MTITLDGGILAGGLSTRMGGEEKGLQLYEGKPMVSWVSEALQPSIQTLFINCNRNENMFERYGQQTCSDLVPGFLGPLAGIHSLLSQSQADYLLISPCDTPLISPNYARVMLQELEAQSFPQILVAKSGNKIHPLHMCISRSLLGKLEKSLEAKQLKVMRWLDEQKPQYIDFENQASVCFDNFNTLEDLQKN